MIPSFIPVIFSSKNNFKFIKSLKPIIYTDNINDSIVCSEITSVYILDQITKSICGRGQHLEFHSKEKFNTDYILKNL